MKLTNKDEKRYSLLPIQYNDIWQHYKESQALNWTAEEIDLKDDLNDWKKLNEDEQYFIKMVLAFFNQSDSIVNENLAENFLRKIQILEAKCFYGFQIAIENVHSETYSLLIDTYIKDNEEKSKLFNAIQNFPFIKTKSDWAFQWIETDDLTKQLVAFACVEGIFFSGSFASIFWLKNKGLMPGLCFANELISRDEGLHCNFAVHLYKHYVEDKLDEQTIHKIVKDACEIEKEFVTNALPVSLIGMNSDKMCQYIEYVTDRLLIDLGYSKIYNTTQPFQFMEMISMKNKMNFFEGRVSEYTKAFSNKTNEENEITFNNDF